MPEQALKIVDAPMDARSVIDQVQHIQQILKTVMKEGVHYGTIPGTKEKSLWKPGAEKILMTFRLACDPQVEDLSTADKIHYRVTANLITQSGLLAGYGIGECTSDEEKYRWRKAVCDEEFDATSEAYRRIKYGHAKNGHYTIKQIRAEPADIANTVLKMAKKRAMIDGVLTCTAASDVFHQDLEDLPYEILANSLETRPISENEIKRLENAIRALSIDSRIVLEIEAINSLSEILTPDLKRIRRLLVGLGVMPTRTLIKEMKSIEDADALREAMAYYPEGDPVRDEYAEKVTLLAAGVKNG